MRSSDDLFQLIKSLDKNEKRYFKLAVSKYTSAEDSNYIKLFDAIDTQEEYNEEKLKKKFKGKKIEKNFPTEKNYLYRLILKSLRGYSQEQTSDHKIKDMIREAEFLYKKALYDQSEKILSRAKELAITHEKLLLLLEIYEMEGQQLPLTENIEKTARYIEDDLPNALGILKKIENLAEFTKYHLQLYITYMKSGDEKRNTEILDEVESIISLPIYKDERSALTFLAKSYFYFMKRSYYRMQNDFENTMKYSRKEVQLFESHPHILTEQISLYANSLINYAINQFESKKFDDCHATLKKLRNIQTRSEFVKLKILSRYYELTFSMYAVSGNFEKVTSEVNEAKTFIESNKGKLAGSLEHNIKYNVAYCFFGTGNYKEAIRWINKTLNETADEKVFPEKHCYARILNLAIHYELGNYDLLDSLIRSTGRYLNKKNLLFDTEELFIDFIDKIIIVTSEKEKLAEFAKFRKHLESVYGKYSEKQNPGYFNFFEWIDSKLLKKSFAEIIKEKSKSLN